MIQASPVWCKPPFDCYQKYITTIHLRNYFYSSCSIMLLFPSPCFCYMTIIILSNKLQFPLRKTKNRHKATLSLWLSLFVSLAPWASTCSCTLALMPRLKQRNCQRRCKALTFTCGVGACEQQVHSPVAPLRKPIFTWALPALLAECKPTPSKWFSFTHLCPPFKRYRKSWSCCKAYWCVSEAKWVHSDDFKIAPELLNTKFNKKRVAHHTKPH